MKKPFAEPKYLGFVDGEIIFVQIEQMVFQGRAIFFQLLYRLVADRRIDLRCVRADKCDGTVNLGSKFLLKDSEILMFQEVRHGGVFFSTVVLELAFFLLCLRRKKWLKKCGGESNAHGLSLPKN
ncbi:MAG TPA: hypothetical protein VM571_06065 [Noviherbaspirillum sp.]|nr:hypothetical protein [Noviherbaspirillum sp.]